MNTQAKNLMAMFTEVTLLVSKTLQTQHTKYSAVCKADDDDDSPLEQVLILVKL